MNIEIITRQDAQSQGLKFYFTGETCIKDHRSTRYVKTHRCLECNRQFARNWATENPERNRLRAKTWAVENPEQNRKRASQWVVDNRGQANASRASRKIAKIKRTPPWADLEEIKQFYIDCPKGMHVDHIVPLQGELISGLHVLGNLQYLTPYENLSKGNRWTPD